MSYRNAKQAFESALQIAEQEGDAKMEFLLHGLIALTKAIQADVDKMHRQIGNIDSNIRSLR